MALLSCIVFGLVACASGEHGSQQPSKAAKNSSAATSEASKKSAPQEQGGENTQTPTTTAQPSANTGTITGRVTDKDTGEPISDTYITVGWENSQLATITDADGRYTVSNVPAGEPAPVLGFHPNGYRYHNSSFDDHLKIMLKPGETYTYNFSLFMLETEGQPEVSDPSVSSESVAPGETVTFGLNAGRGGEGGLSREVFAASPKLGRLVLLKPADGENAYSAKFTIPADTPPGEYPFAFFTASNECYVNGTFPMRTLRVT